MADDVQKYSKRLDRQRERGLKYSLDAVDSLYANLSATQKGLARTLTNENSRTLSKLAAMSSRIAAQSVRAVNGASAGMVGSYGALYGGQVAQQLDPARATTEAIGAAGVAALQTGKGLMRAGNEAMAIQVAGVEDAKAAAQYALAQASIARAQADADAVAALKAQQAAAGLRNEYPGIDGIAQMAGNISKEVRREIRDQLEAGDGKNVQLMTVVQNVALKLGFDGSNPAQIDLIRNIAQSIYAQQLWYGSPEAAREKGGKGESRQAEIDLIVQAILMFYDGSVRPKDEVMLETVVRDYLTKIYPKPGDDPKGGNDNTTPNASPLTGVETGRIAPGDRNDFNPQASGSELEAQFRTWGYSAADAKELAKNWNLKPVGRNDGTFPRGDFAYYAKDDEKANVETAIGTASRMYAVGMSLSEIRQHFAGNGFGKDALDYIMMRIEEIAAGRGASGAPRTNFSP